MPKRSFQPGPRGGYRPDARTVARRFTGDRGGELGRDREAEQSLKQRTGARYTSRPIDIDILFYDDRVIRTERLTVPHPLIQEREFVLVPLCEWMRDYRHPVLGKTVGELLEELKIGMKPMKKHKFKILTFVAVAAALAGTGCFKSIGYETFYVLRPWAQEGTVKTPIPREDMLAYAFDADTTEWSVLSYEDAVAGIITSGEPARSCGRSPRASRTRSTATKTGWRCSSTAPGFSSWPWTSRIGFTDSPSRPSGRIFRRCT